MLESGEVKLEDIWFSDETSLSVNKLGYNRRNDAVYRHEDQPMDSMPDSLRYAAKVHFAKGFVAAAAISKSGQTGRTPISVLPEGQIVDQSYYKHMMQSHYVPNIKASIGRGGKWVWQQDNARPRVAKSVREYFKSAGIEVLPWPGSSPDLNPLDYGYWACLKDDIRRKLPRNLGDIKGCLVEAHNEFDRQRLNNIIDAFPGRLRRCVELGGEELGASEGISSGRAGDSLMDVDK